MPPNQPIPTYTLEEIQVLAGYFRDVKNQHYLDHAYFRSLENFYIFLQNDKWRLAPLLIPFKDLPLHINRSSAYRYWNNSVVSWRLQIGK